MNKRRGLPPPERGRSVGIADRVGVASVAVDPSPDRLWRSDPPLAGEGSNAEATRST
jgi:hypothetical protein